MPILGEGATGRGRRLTDSLRSAAIRFCRYPEGSSSWEALQVGRVEVEEPLPGLQEKSAPHHDAAQGAAPMSPQTNVPQGRVPRHRS